MDYVFTDPDHTQIQATDSETGYIYRFNTESGKYKGLEIADLLDQIEPYVAPPEPEPLTAQQKLANAGLTVDELKELLGL